MIKVPSDKSPILTQPNRGNSLGTLNSTFNIDLTTVPAKVRTTGMIRTTTEGTDTDMTSAPMGFKRVLGSIWTIAGTKVHSTPIGSEFPRFPFVVDATASSPTTIAYGHSDLEVFNGALYVSGYNVLGASLYKYDGSWATNGTGIGTGSHYMTTFGDRLYITHRTGVYSMNTSDSIATSGQYTLELPSLGGSNNKVTFVQSASNRIWIGWSMGRSGEGGLVYEWDGSSSQATKVYKLEVVPFACVIKDDIPYIFGSNGRLMAWNGGTFVEVARLPLDEEQLAGAFSFDSFPVHPNGMCLSNGRINILIRNELANSSASINEKCPSGIWEYDPEIGLYHKHSFRFTPVGTTTVTDFGQNRIVQPGALVEMKNEDTNAAAVGTLLAGADLYTTLSTNDCGVFVNDTLDTTKKFGYFTTAELNGEGVADIFQKVYLNYGKLLNSGDKIIVKYRANRQAPAEMAITWTSTTTFTTTDANMANYSVGDEVEITRGKGGGMCSHITVISENAGTYTVTVDETHTGASGTATARLQKWIKAGSITDQASTYKELPLSAITVPQSWLQVKVCFYWTGKNEFERLTIAHTTGQSAT